MLGIPEGDDAKTVSRHIEDPILSGSGGPTKHLHHLIKFAAYWGPSTGKAFQPITDHLLA